MIETIIHALNAWPPELPLFILFLFSCIIILVMARFFGQPGLYVYGVLAIVMGNIQVLKGVHLTFWENPVALGTIIFSSSFVTTDVLTECFGPKASRKVVGLGFVGVLFVAGSMLMTLGVAPLHVVSTSEDYHFVLAHQAMRVLFTPSFAILGASFISYIASQLFDIFFFQKLRQASYKMGLWMRSGLSTAIAFLIDNTVFSTLAWVVFSSAPVSMHSLIWTYILGTYLLRLLTMVMYLPVVYGACKMIRVHHGAV